MEITSWNQDDTKKDVDLKGEDNTVWYKVWYAILQRIGPRESKLHKLRRPRNLVCGSFFPSTKYGHKVQTKQYL